MQVSFPEKLRDLPNTAIPKDMAPRPRVEQLRYVGGGATLLKVDEKIALDKLPAMPARCVGFSQGATGSSGNRNCTIASRDLNRGFDTITHDAILEAAVWWRVAPWCINAFVEPLMNTRAKVKTEKLRRRKSTQARRQDAGGNRPQRRHVSKPWAAIQQERPIG